MPDLPQQLRDHYAGKSLAPSKVEAILTLGRAEYAGEAKSEPRKIMKFPNLGSPRLTKALAFAAILAMAAAIGSLWWGKRDQRVAFDSIPNGMIAFFAGKPDLHHAPQDKAALRAWLLAHGAPRDFHIPSSLLGLESFACQVVKVDGRDLYLSCYWREQRADRGERELVHLLVGRKSDFRGAPESVQPKLREFGGWSFASWSDGDVVYTLATPAPMTQLRPFLTGGPGIGLVALIEP